MASILDQIRRNQVPQGVLRTASKGALPLPAGEMIEVLVYLTQNPIFAQEARMTLAGWDPVATVECVADPASPPEVLGYFWAEENRRPVLMPALIENPAIAEELLMEAAATATREILNMLLASPRARSSPAVVEALSTNIRLTPEELRELRGETAAEKPATQGVESDPETEAAHRAWVEEHATEVAAEEGKAFELAVTDEEETGTTQADGPAAGSPATVPEALPAGDPTAAAPDPARMDSAQTLALAALAGKGRDASVPTEEEKKFTVLQRIGRMSVAERVKAAFTGSREERSILIRDVAKIVQNAVLSSPKLTEPEVETFASAKNVHDNVLREIARNRRFIKNYAVQRNLVQNPKTPLEISLNLVRNLMVYDLKSLQRSRSVSETIRSIAQKLYREKAMSGGKTKS